MSTGHTKALRLVADIGGTHARFALAQPGSQALSDEHELATSDYPDIDGAIRAYLALVDGQQPTEAALAIANPVTGDAIRMTNNTWAFSIAGLKKSLGLERLIVLNDFEALALSVPALGPGALRQIGPGVAVPNAPIALLGPGTGLGMAALVHIAGDWHALVSEGGHVTAPVINPRIAQIVAHLAARYGHVSAERLISGPGLVNLYEGLAQLDGTPAPARSAEEISTAGLSDSDPLCRAALETFCALLGTLAGDLALTLAARGGIYLGGGIAPRLADFLEASDFRRCFEAKGRMQGFLASIPTYIIEAPHAAMLGDLVALDRAAQDP